MKRALILFFLSFWVLLTLACKANHVIVDLDNQENIEYFFGAFLTAVSLIIATFQRHYNKKFMIIAFIIYFIYPILCGIETAETSLAFAVLGYLLMDKKTVTKMNEEMSGR